MVFMEGGGILSGLCANEAIACNCLLAMMQVLSFVLSTAVGGGAYPDRGLACFVVGVVALYLLVCAKHRRLLIMGFIRDVILFVRVAGLMRPAYDVLGSFKTVMRGIERD